MSAPSGAPEEPTLSVGEGPGFFRRHATTLVASLLLAVAFAWLLSSGGLPLVAPKGTLEHVDWLLVIACWFGLLISVLTRFARFHLLISPIAAIPLARIMVVSCVAVGLITFLPFRIGELARPAMLRDKDKLSGWAVTGTVGAERIIDGVVFSVMLLVGLALAAPHEPLPDRIGDLPVPAAWVPKIAWLSALVFGAAFSVMAAFYWRRRAARELTERTLGLISERWARRIADVVERTSEGLRFLPNARNTGTYLAITLFSLWAHAWALQLLADSVGLPSLDLAQATVVLGVLGLGFALPNAPGFFGSVQLALYAGLAVYVPPGRVQREGAAFVFLFYVSYLVLIVVVTLFGLVADYAMTRRAAKARARPDSAGGG